MIVPMPTALIDIARKALAPFQPKPEATAKSEVPKGHLPDKRKPSS